MKSKLEYKFINLLSVMFILNGCSTIFEYGRINRSIAQEESVAPSNQKYFSSFGPQFGRHVSWGDINNDGYDDLLLWHAPPAQNNGSVNDVKERLALYLNKAGKYFVDITKLSGLSEDAGESGVFGDFNNDGCLDLFITNLSNTKNNTLYKSNCDETFSDVTQIAGLEISQGQSVVCDGGYAKSKAATWIDYNSDGYLDLAVANGYCFGGHSETTEKYFDTALYKNNRNGTFSDVSVSAKLTGFNRSARSITSIDFDQDGDMDLLVTNYLLMKNLLFINNGNGTFSEKGIERNLSGGKGHTVGSNWADLNGDGHFDNIQTGLVHPRYLDSGLDQTKIYISNGKGSFVDGATDIRYQEGHATPLLQDFNNDGNVDLFITGMYDARKQHFYFGQGNGRFIFDADRAGVTTLNPAVGAAGSDIDGDGDVDFYTEYVWRNNIPHAGNYISIKVVGQRILNRSAIGTTVKVHVGTHTFLSYVPGSSGSAGQDSQYLHIGLGQSESIDSIELIFPGGSGLTFSGPIGVNRRIWLFENGSLEEGHSI